MNKIAFALLLACSLFGQLTPSNPKVKVGGTLYLSAPTAITCPSTGYVGTFSGCGTTSVTYTAPASIDPQLTAQALQLVPNNSIWVTPVTSLPIDSQSAAKVTALGTYNIGFDYAWSLGLVPSGTTTFTPLSFYLPGNTYGTYPDPQFSQFYSGTEQSGLDGISGYTNGNNADHHTVLIDNSSIIQPSTVGGWIYEIYDKYLNGALRTCNGCTSGTYTANTEGNQDYSTASYSLANGNINAAGTLIAPLTLTLNDVENGGNHMLSFTACAGCFYYSAHSWPATANLGSGSACSICLQFGDVIHIKTSVLASLKSTYCTGSSATRCQNILNQLSSYGQMLVDVGITGQINIDPKVSLDPLNVEAVAQVSSIPINSTNFEKVNTQSLEVSSSSSEVCPISQTCMSGIQSYLTPISDAWVSVAGVIYPISIQGVAVGLASNIPSYIPMVAGSYSVNLTSRVTGASMSSVTWSLLSGPGSITTGGAYTPPSSAGSVSNAVLKATSNADTNQTASVIIEVFPQGSPSLVQDDTDSSSNTLDFNGNTWYADLGVENNYYSNSISGYSTSQTPYANQFNTGMSYFGDWRKYYFLPNGNYTLNLLLGQNQCNNSAAACAGWVGQYLSLYNLTPYAIEVNGQIQSHQVDWSASTDYFYSTGNIVSVPATVTNNFLEIGLYKTSPDISVSGSFQCSVCVNANYAPASQSPFAILNGLSIATDSTSPYLGIDLGNVQPAISPGGYFQAWPVDGHINLPLGPGTITWSLVSAPAGATITPDSYDNGALIYLPAGTYKTSQYITIQAVYGSYSAKANIKIAGTGLPYILTH